MQPIGDMRLEELKKKLEIYFSRVYEEEDVRQGKVPDASYIGAPCWYGADEEPLFEEIAARVGQTPSQVKLNYEGWLKAGNKPPTKKTVGTFSAPEYSMLPEGGSASEGSASASKPDGLSSVTSTMREVAAFTREAENLDALEPQTSAVPSGAIDQKVAEMGVLFDGMAKMMGANKTSGGSETSTLALMLDMNNKSAERQMQASQQAQGQQNQMMNLMIQMMNSNQQTLMQSMGNSPKSNVESKLLDMALGQMMNPPDTSPEESLFKELIRSEQLPEIGKGLMDGFASIMAARSPPTTNVPAYMSEAQAPAQVTPQVQLEVPAVAAPPGAPAFDEKCTYIMEGFHQNLPDTFKSDDVYMAVLGRQIEIAVQQAEIAFPDDVRAQLGAADRILNVVVNLRSICKNIKGITEGTLPITAASEYLKKQPLSQAFVGETYDSLMAQLTPFAAADPEGKKLLQWDLEFLSREATKVTVEQLLVDINKN